MRQCSASCRGSTRAAECPSRTLVLWTVQAPLPGTVSSSAPAWACCQPEPGHLTHFLFLLPLHSNHKALLFHCASVCAFPAAGLPGQRGGNACQAAAFAPSCCGWWERPELPAFGPKSRFSPEGRLPSGVGGLPARLARHRRMAPAWPLSCVPVPARLGQGWIVAPGEYLGVSSPEGRCVPLTSWLPRVPVLSQLPPYSLPPLRPCPP